MEVTTRDSKGKYLMQLRCEHCGISPHEFEEEKQLVEERRARREEASPHTFVECVTGSGEQNTSLRCKDCGFSSDDIAETKQQENGEDGLAE